MTYHAPTNQFTIHPEDLKRAAASMRYAIRKIRDAAGIDAKGYDWIQRESDAAEAAEDGILSAAKALSIDLGADRPGKLDVSSDT